MNIALPALTILLGLLPGISFYYAYFAGRFEKRRAGISGLEEIGLYVIFAIPIDVIAFWVCEQFGVQLNLSVATHLLAGTLSEGAIAAFVVRLEHSIGKTALIYMAILVTSAVVGFIARRIVWALRIDTYFTLAQWRHPWYYIFQGRQPGVPKNALAWVDVLVEHDEDKTRLYRGLVSDFDMASDGKLESIVLKGVRRGKGRGDTFDWVDIPSNHFVIMGCKIHSINVSYWQMNEGDDVQAIDAETLDAQVNDVASVGLHEAADVKRTDP